MTCLTTNSLLLLTVFSLLALTYVNGGPMKAGFVYFDSPADLQWNYQIDAGRQSIQTSFGRQVLRTYYEIAQTDEELPMAIDLLVEKGCYLIFISAWYQQDLMLNLSSSYPKVKFVVLGGKRSKGNVNSVYIKQHHGFYVGGLMAGRLTKTNITCLLVSSDDPLLVLPSLSFFVGANDANDDIKMVLLDAGSSKDSRKTRKAVEILRNRYGCDVITGLQNNLQVSASAKELGMKAFGYPSTIRKLVNGDAVYSGIVIQWAGALAYYVNKTLNNRTWIPSEVYYYGFPEGISIIPPSDDVDDPTADLVASQIIQLNRGYCVFNNRSLLSAGAYFAPSAFAATGCLIVDTALEISYDSFNASSIIILEPLTDDMAFTPVFIQPDSSTAIVIVVLVSILDGALIFSVILVYIYRRYVIIAATNQYFCYSVLIGAMFGYSSLFFWIDEPNKTMCSCRIWFLNISFWIIFGAIASKMYRIWRLWQNPELKTERSSIYVLLAFVLTVTIIQLALLVSLSVTGGYVVGKSFDAALDYDEYFSNCELTNAGVIIVAIILAINGLMVVTCAILAYLSKNVSQKFNEIPSIILSIYSVIISAVVVLILFLNIGTNNPERQMIFITCGVFISISFPLICIFLPKFKILLSDASSSSKFSSGKKATNISSVDWKETQT